MAVCDPMGNARIVRLNARLMPVNPTEIRFANTWNSLTFG